MMAGTFGKLVRSLFAPSAEAVARDARLSYARMAYDAATKSRRSQGWRVVSTDANAETPVNGRLRDIARDMLRNNADAVRARQVIAHNVVGKGIIPTVAGLPGRAAGQMEELLKAHLDTSACDASGQMDLYGLQALVMATVVESGECLVRYRPRLASDGLPLPFQLQVLEPDHIDTSINGPQADGTLVVQGIAFNGVGRRVGYWLFPQHPGSMASYSWQASKFVPADQIAHIYRIDRPGQVRGVTWFAPVILKMRDLSDYADAQLVRQKIAACFAAFITTDEEAPAEAISPAGEGEVYDVEAFEPGMIERLRDGESITFATPPSVGDFDGYTRATKREIAAGLGISYEAFTGDYSQVSFSSGRMGWIEFQRSVDAWRHHMLAPQLLEPVARWTLDSAALIGAPVAGAKMMWTAPQREMINPSEETRAAILAIRGGLSSRSHEQRKLGFDPADIDAEIAADNKRADKLGLVLDSDPRKVSAAGLTQPPQADPEPAAR